MKRSTLTGTAIALSLALFACSLLGEDDAPPQGWWHARGPVVPHDSFPTDCALCHTGATWSEIREDFAFDHLAETGVALEGAHTRAECLRCHNDRGPAGMYAARGCAGCHEDVHLGRQGQNCGDCHGVEDWRVADAIALHDSTRFPLVGAHAAAACFRCHLGAQVGDFSRADVECITCHRADLALAVSPDHVTENWVMDCDRCHIPTGWTGSGFNHAAFPLTGAHATASCTSCHQGGIFAGTPNACSACHQAEYDATTDPDHASANFPLSCETCHGTSTWSGAFFAHTSFPLTGAHAAASCQSCHAGNVYQGTPSSCVACHQAEYDATVDPNHASAGFPTDCMLCHGTSMWQGALFQHTFPITNGAHKDLDCMECHLAPSSFSTFSCTHCHEHDQGGTDADHDEVSGYVYSSPACYSCHPDGDE